MKRLKKFAGELSVFEKEIRNPEEHLQEAIKNIRKEDLSIDDAKPIIDKAIEEDIGYDRSKIIEYFDTYSDWYKDCYGIRPRTYLEDYYHAIYDFMVQGGKDSCNYSDYSSLDFSEEDYDDYEEEENLVEKYLNEVRERKNEESSIDEYEKLPLQQSHHKGANEMRKHLKKTAGNMYEIKCEATVSKNYFIEDANSKEEAGVLALNLFKKDLDATDFRAKDLKVVAWS